MHCGYWNEKNDLLKSEFLGKKKEFCGNIVGKLQEKGHKVMKKSFDKYIFMALKSIYSIIF